MDFADIKASTARVDIRHPATQEPTGLVVWLKPMSDPALKAIQRRFTNEALRHRGMKLTAEKADANRTDILVAAIERWEWNDEAEFNGEKPELTAENVRKVLKVEWVRDQLDEALGDEAAFFSA